MTRGPRMTLNDSDIDDDMYSCALLNLALSKGSVSEKPVPSAIASTLGSKKLYEQTRKRGNLLSSRFMVQRYID